MLSKYLDMRSFEKCHLIGVYALMSAHLLEIRPERILARNLLWALKCQECNLEVNPYMAKGGDGVKMPLNKIWGISALKIDTLKNIL